MSKYKVGDRFLVRIDKVLHVKNGCGEFDDYIMNAEPPKDRDEIYPTDGCVVTERFLDQCSLLDTEEEPDMGEVYDGYHTMGKRSISVCKEIPESPHPDGDTSILCCPNCGSGEYLDNYDGNENDYCGQCGQKINWNKKIKN